MFEMIGPICRSHRRVLNMMKNICIVCLLSIACLRMEGQSLQVSGAKIELPPGDVLGAAFYEGKGLFFVQQSVLSTETLENDKLTTHLHRQMFHRQLSSWNLVSHVMVSQRVIGEVPGRLSHSCGRVQVSITLHQVYVCSANSQLDIMDPNTLENVGAMAQVDGQTIMDFAVDDLNSRALVLSAQKDNSILLTSYSLLTGEKQHETMLPAINREGIGAPPDLVSVSRSGQIGVYLHDYGFIKNSSGIYMCSDAPNLTCVKVITDTDGVSEMSFLGQDILGASSQLADDRWLCIFSVSPDYKYSIKKPLSFGASSKYCSRNISFYNSHGVHYAVGVVEDKYVVGFTGADGIDHLSGFSKPVSTSFSVWRAGNSKVAAVVKIPTDHGVQQAFRIVGSNTQPLFIAYHGLSNTLYLYSIAEH
jgi:hypothetical protein